MTREKIQKKEDEEKDTRVFFLDFQQKSPHQEVLLFDANFVLSKALLSSTRQREEEEEHVLCCFFIFGRLNRVPLFFIFFFSSSSESSVRLHFSYIIT